jgi:hypothetical protein
MRVVIDYAMRTLHLSRNADAQVERVERAHLLRAGLILALTELAKAAPVLKTQNAWQVWHDEV